MTRGIGEKIGPPPELDPPGYPKDLIFSNYAKEVLARIPGAFLIVFLPLVPIFILAMLVAMITGSLVPAIFLLTLLLSQLVIVPLVIFPMMMVMVYFLFTYQKVFREHNKVFLKESDVIVDHTEWPGSQFIRNWIPLSIISSVDPAGPDYWERRKGSGSFWQRKNYPRHLPPEGGLYHSHSDPDNLFVITLRTPQEIDSPYRKVKWFHFIQSEKALVKEIVVDIGREHQGPFLKEISSKGIRVTDRKKSSIPPGSENGYPVFGGGEIDLRNSGLEMRHVKIG